MKRVAFITVHIGINVGSNLQAIATSEVLKKSGYDPILINYIPPRVTYRRYWSRAITSPKYFIWSVLHFPRQYYIDRLFDRYLKKYCRLSKPIYKEDNFSQLIPQADIYLTGSDQVWNFKWNEGYDGHYFYDGIEGEKVSYAASIGMSTLSDKQSSILKEKLSEYKKISVRENQAVEILKGLGFSAIQHIDPTLMLNKEEWSKFMSKRLVKSSYLLVYLPYNIVDKDKIFNFAKRIASNKGLIVVTFMWWGYSKDEFADQTVFFASPGDFLSLMYYADYVVTNSFHGTAFSVNLNKQFWVFEPSMFSSRIKSLLELLSLENRLVCDSTVDISDGVIDYTCINKTLDKERERAYAYLKEL